MSGVHKASGGSGAVVKARKKSLDYYPIWSYMFRIDKRKDNNEDSCDKG